MSKNPSDTIVAPATPPGKGGIGIVRISGPLSATIAQQMLGTVPPPRQAYFAKFKNKINDIIDEGIALYFSAPHSFTGEDILELQGHGGPIVMDLLIQQALMLGARLAKPGEFSERAFLNNKLDLAQAEAIADLIDASSAQAARAALHSLQGEFSHYIHQLVDAIIHLRMYVEAAIDFAEEEIDFLSDGHIATQLHDLNEKILIILKQAQQGVLLREGMTVVIAGKPNAGKSSLLNNLSGRDTAIVTAIPGTTRDILREHIQLDGMPLQIIDTAGLRESTDEVEQEGIRRAKQAIENADRILWVTDITTTLDIPAELKNHPRLTIIKNKIDLIGETPLLITENPAIIQLSAQTQQGINLLKQHLKQCMGFNSESGQFSARRRHLIALEKAQQWIVHAQDQLQQHRAGEFVAEDLRLAQQFLNEITGEFTTEDLLGKIFQSFCVGK